MDWTDDAIAQLKKLWAEGLSTAKIGAIMGISKNAVVGKAHRLQLESRPSPIKAAVPGATPTRAATPKRVPAPTLARPSQVETPAVTPVAVATPIREKVAAPQLAMRPAPVRVVTNVRPRPGAVCCWPLGEPGTPQFRFCDASAAQGRPYCAEHVQIAYVRIRDRREDVA
jgi:GcrA cell cycle regulator